MRAPSKYGAVRTEVDGIKFASKKEARRYAELKLLERAGTIKDLELQKRYPLKVNGNLVCTYVSDFVYHDNVLGHPVIEDAKGVRTPVFIIKAKLFEAIHGFRIMEV